ncbi:MAG: glycosyltransferase family 2 protein [Lentisphaerae bacterium]|nr:glycosyltransferase family 2 protein [Lentisphaerota bacterium]
MKFSILMPVYNAEKSVSRSIESALNQSCGDFELLCCDDGSGDGSLKVLQQYAAVDSRVKVLVNDENIGALRTRNRLIREFEGDYCVWLDADDELHPSFLQTAKELLDQEAWDVIHFNHVERYSDGRPDHDVFYNHGSWGSADKFICGTRIFSLSIVVKGHSQRGDEKSGRPGDQTKNHR